MSVRDVPDWSIAVLFAAAVLVVGLWLVASGTSLTHEDGFYYFRIAEHVASGHGSTFDGRHLTNGFHPLWLLLLVPVFWLAPSAGAALTAGVLMQVVLSAVAVTLVYYTARLLMGRVGAVLAAQLWLVFTASVTLGGQEFAVQAVGVLATAHLYLRTRPDVRSAPVATYGALGLLLALTALARLETFALAVMVGGWLVWTRVRRGDTGQHAARLAAFGLPVLLVALVYVAANLTLFGYPVPVSAAVKREWSAALLIGAIADDVMRRRADGLRRPWVLALSVVALLIVPANAAVEVRAWQAEQQRVDTITPLHDAARWVSRHVPPDAVVGSWNAGAIGFLSGREVVNLDGLVNSWDYFRHDRHDLCRYWAKAGISYIVDIFDGTQPVTPVPIAWSRDDCADRMQPLLVDDRYQASWRVEAYFVGSGDPGL